MPAIGAGSETKVDRSMPIGEVVMVILIESSMSGEQCEILIGLSRDGAEDDMQRT